MGEARLGLYAHSARALARHCTADLRFRDRSAQDTRDDRPDAPLQGPESGPGRLRAHLPHGTSRLFEVGSMNDSHPVEGTIHDDVVVPPGQPWSGVVSKGDVLRIVDLKGRQAVDFICFNARATEEAYDSTVTLRIAKSIFLSKG